MHSVGMPTGESERVSRPVSGLRKARAGAQIGQQQDKFIDWQGFLLQSGRDGESLALMKKAGDDTAASGHGFLGDQSQIQPRGSQSPGRRRRRFQSGLSSRRIRIMGG